MNARTLLYDLARRGVHVTVDPSGRRCISGPREVVEPAMVWLGVYRTEVVALLRTCDRCGTTDTDTAAAYWSPDRLCADCVAILADEFEVSGWPPVPPPSWTPNDPDDALLAYAFRGPAAHPQRRRA